MSKPMSRDGGKRTGQDRIRLELESSWSAKVAGLRKHVSRGRAAPAMDGAETWSERSAQALELKRRREPGA